jgi:hypothetical protein
MVLEQGAVNCRRVLNVSQPLWSECHFTRETNHYGVFLQGFITEILRICRYLKNVLGPQLDR